MKKKTHQNLNHPHFTHWLQKRQPRSDFCWHKKPDLPNKDTGERQSTALVDAQRPDPGSEVAFCCFSLLFGIYSQNNIVSDNTWRSFSVFDNPARQQTSLNRLELWPIWFQTPGNWTVYTILWNMLDFFFFLKKGPLQTEPRPDYLASFSCLATARISLAPLLSSSLARSTPSRSALSWASPGILLAVTPTLWTHSSTSSGLWTHARAR